MAIAAVIALAGCSPKYDWREVHGTDAPFVVLLPAKPTTLSRPVNLDGVQVTMAMTAAEVGGVTFAVGSAELPDAGTAQLALLAMKRAMLNNIKGTIQTEKSAAAAAASGAAATGSIATDIEAAGSIGGQPARLFARFATKDKRVYQAIALGPEQALSRDAVDTFFTSFKFN
ncbi:MAG TPA: hypothetical protein VJ752_17570 [Burkholderiaceae bacterium]|nr:hypothetical protein [Burkholderiaceae bacterium]